jgi:hypothetical protein
MLLLEITHSFQMFTLNLTMKTVCRLGRVFVNDEPIATYARYYRHPVATYARYYRHPVENITKSNQVT